MAHLFSQWILPSTIALIMFGIGLSVIREDFRRIIKQPAIVVTGLTAHMILLPLIAFTMAVFLPIPSPLKIGLMLIAACPDGTTVNLVNYWLKGNLALSLTLTVITSFLILITLPLIVKFSLNFFSDQSAISLSLPLSEIVTNVSLVVVLPVIFGMLIKRYFGDFAKKIEKPLEISLTILLFLVYAAVIILEKRRGTTQWSGYLTILWLTLALNLIALTVGYFYSRALIKDNRDSYTIAMQVGLQNSALAIYVATSLLQNPDIAVVAVVYGSFSFFTTLIFGYLARRYGDLITFHK